MEHIIVSFVFMGCAAVLVTVGIDCFYGIDKIMLKRFK